MKPLSKFKVIGQHADGRTKYARDCDDCLAISRAPRKVYEPVKRPAPFSFLDIDEIYVKRGMMTREQLSALRRR